RGAAGVEIQPVAVLRGERQAAQESELAFVELRARPFDRQHGLVIHALARSDRGAVMITEQRGRAARDEFPDGVDRKARIRAVTDIVAEKNKPIDRAPARMREAGLERLAIA